jgi:hypothetical protein
MLKHKVPQDIENMHEGNYKTVVYAVDENGNYVRAQTSGWEPENIAHEMAWDLVEKRIKQAKQDVLNGKLSPLAFFAEREQMTVKRLAGMAGISKWRVKRHFKPEIFKKLKKKYIEKYCEIFGVSTYEFTNFNTEKY